MSIARLAHHALDADALAIATRGGGAAVRWSATVGLGDEDERAVSSALELLDSELDRREVVTVDSLERSQLPGAALLAAHGFTASASAAVRIEGERVGSLHALATDATAFDEGLVAAFARHAAIALAHRRLRSRTARLAQRLETLEALDELVLVADDFADLTRALTRTVAPLVGAQLTGIMVWDDERDVLQMVPGSFGADEEVTASYQISAHDAHSNAARVFATRRPYMSNDAAADPGILKEYADALGIRRVLSLPLGGERPIGVIHLANKETDFTVDDLERAEALAPRIATVVDLARTLFRLRRRQRLEGILSEMAVAIASAEDVQDFLARALEELVAAADANVVAFVPVEAPAVVVRNGRELPRLEAQLLAEARTLPAIRAYVVGPRRARDPGHAVFHVGVRLHSQQIGTLSALRARGEPFTADERNAFTRLANLAALSWATERYQQQRAAVARLQERHRIADDLHDDVAQILFAAQLTLDSVLEREEVPAPVAEELARARALLVRGDAAIRTVIQQLSRGTSAELAPRLLDVVAAVEQEFGLPIHVDVAQEAASAGKGLRKPVADALVKVAREALVNAAKHAGPCRASVGLRLNRRGELVLTVVDDGLGLSPAGTGSRHGLASLRRTVADQGGVVRLRSGRTGGTKVTASVPL